jgi:hypothetical protein
MSDNYTTNPGTGGATFASDDVSGVQFPRVKVTWGADGTAVDASATNPLPVTLQGLVQAEDSPHVSAANGIMMLAVRKDAVAPMGADGDYTPLQTNGAGRLKVSAEPASQEAVTGSITANGQTVQMDTTRTSNITIFCTGTFSTVNVAFEGSLDGTNWFGVQAIRTNANTIETSTGNLSAAPAYAWELSVNGLSFFSVRATAFTSGAQNWRFQSAPYATEPIPGAQISGTQPVSGTVTANIGTGSLAAGTNAIGDVGIQVRANATGAASIHHIVSAATTNVAQIKGTAGRVFGYCLSNTTAAWQYVKLHNVASATAGAAVAMTIGIPPNGKAECHIAQGIGFATAISRSIVTGPADNDTTATTLNAVVGDIFFA